MIFWKRSRSNSFITLRFLLCCFNILDSFPFVFLKVAIFVHSAFPMQNDKTNCSLGRGGSLHSWDK